MPGDKRTTELDEETTPAGTDLVEVVRDPGGTPENVKVQLANLPLGDPAAIQAVDGAWEASATTEADDTSDFATATLAATETAVGSAQVVAYRDAGPTSSVSADVNGVTVISVVDEGTGARLGFFGATPVGQPTFDSGDTDTNRIAALEAALAALGLAVDTA